MASRAVTRVAAPTVSDPQINAMQMMIVTANMAC